MRHGTRIGRSPTRNALRGRYRRQVGRILRAMQAQQQIACHGDRTQHDGATIAISATPDMVPEPSSDRAFQRFMIDTRRTYCFTSCFTEVVPFFTDRACKPFKNRLTENSTLS